MVGYAEIVRFATIVTAFSPATVWIMATDL